MTRVLYIGGTGEISHACVEAAVAAGQDVTVFNRGTRNESLPPGVRHITGDMQDDTCYEELASLEFDTVCQFIGLSTDTIRRDIEVFAGHCAQYLFVSSASAYQKPWGGGAITESTPLENPFWDYSRMKAECEALLFSAHAANKLPVTVVRPSHTFRKRLPGTCFPGDHMAWRILNNKPVIIHDDGESLWTLTHAADFARAFVALCGNGSALGEAFHITAETAQSWNQIVALVGKVLGHEIKTVHVPTDRLIEYSEMWVGPLKGDKANPVVFDNSKVREVTGGWHCESSLEECLEKAAVHTLGLMRQGYKPDTQLDCLLDRVAAEMIQL